MNKSKIDWCDMTWNPVTGCYHGCEYCYARRIAERFGEKPCEQGNCNYAGDCGREPSYNCSNYNPYEKIHDLEQPKYLYNPIRKIPYPYGFEPTFHRYRLDEPKKKTKGKNIFVTSMGDLFGEWVPDPWIDEVMKAITRAPQHSYLFLTKNPSRYWEYVFGAMQELPSEYDFSKVRMMFGTTVTNQAMINELVNYNGDMIDFLSIEPLLGEVDLTAILKMQPCCMEEKSIKWIIVGAQTGPGAKPPEFEWILNIINQTRAAGIPLFLKDNLKWHMKIQEFPKELMHHE